MAYMVKSLGKTVSVMWMGMEAELPLAYAEGMIGAMPVFETREQAEAYADGMFEVAEVHVLQPNNQIQRAP